MPPDSDTTVNSDPETEVEDDKPKPKMFTQFQVSKIMDREKKEGRAQAVREIAEQLGCSVEEAKSFIEEAKERSDKADDDATKRLKKAEDRERKAAELEKKAIAKANTADVIAALALEQMPKAKALKAVRLVDLDLTTEDLTDDEIAEAVQTLKEEMPELFGTPEPDEPAAPFRPVGAPDSTPRGGQRRAPQGQSAMERARQTFLERNPEVARRQEHAKS